jgi:hypothetical protein
VRGLNAEGSERVVQGARDVQERARVLAHDLEHANETINVDLRRNKYALSYTRFGHRRFLLC